MTRRLKKQELGSSSELNRSNDDKQHLNLVTIILTTLLRVSSQELAAFLSGRFSGRPLHDLAFGFNPIPEVIALRLTAFFPKLMGLAGLGTTIKFILYPVTMGFTAGIAVVIFSG